MAKILDPDGKFADVSEAGTTVRPLSQASTVGEVVRGSSAQSRYVCVVIGNHLSLAGRITGNSLSVRVEPRLGKESHMAEAAASLTALGFTMHDGTYASAHMAAESPLKAFMGLSAFMAGVVHVFGGVALPLESLPAALLKGV